MANYMQDSNSIEKGQKYINYSKTDIFAAFDVTNVLNAASTEEDFIAVK